MEKDQFVLHSSRFSISFGMCYWVPVVGQPWLLGVPEFASSGGLDVWNSGHRFPWCLGWWLLGGQEDVPPAAIATAFFPCPQPNLWVLTEDFNKEAITFHWDLHGEEKRTEICYYLGPILMTLSKLSTSIAVFLKHVLTEYQIQNHLLQAPSSQTSW